MARAPFSISTRPSHDRQTGKSVTRYVARFFDPSGKVCRTVTLSAKSRSKAVLEAQDLLSSGGLPTEDPLVLDFVLEFWRPDSPYAKLARLRGSPLTIQYIETQAYVVKKHLLTPLRGVRLRELTADRLDSLILELSDKGTAPRTVNGAMCALRVPVSDWARKKRIPDPFEYVRLVAEKPRPRGTLSVEEISKIIAIHDQSPRARAAILLGALCGLRMGEVRGLQWEDVDRQSGILHVVHNYVDDREGVKEPKCGSARDVPLPDVVLKALEECRSMNPHNSAFVIWNVRSQDRPAKEHTIDDGFKRMLNAIGIPEEDRRRRNLVFHGLRHTYVSLSRAVGLPDFIVQRLAGHKTSAMMEHYSHVENLVDFSAAREKIQGAFALAKQ